MSTKAFNEVFRYQGNQLGNVVHGLEMIAEYLEHHWSHGAQYALAQDGRRLLVHIPRGHLPPALVTRLRALSLLNEDETPGVQDTVETHRPAANAVLLLLVDQTPQPSGLVRELWVELAQPYAQRRGFPLEAANDFCRALAAGCLAAGQLLEQVGILPVATMPEDYVFHVASGIFGGNPRLQGASVWLAGALSYVALWGGLPLPGGIAATGHREENGQHVARRAASVEAKYVSEEHVTGHGANEEIGQAQILCYGVDLAHDGHRNRINRTIRLDAKHA